MHQVIVVSICHIELASRELRVVSHVNSFIAELASDLVDAVNAANYQHLPDVTHTASFTLIYCLHDEFNSILPLVVHTLSWRAKYEVQAGRGEVAKRV